ERFWLLAVTEIRADFDRLESPLGWAKALMRAVPTGPWGWARGACHRAAEGHTRWLCPLYQAANLLRRWAAAEWVERQRKLSGRLYSRADGGAQPLLHLVDADISLSPSLINGR